MAYVPPTDRQDNEIPPTPAILNAQGLSAALSILASSIPHFIFPPIDISPDPRDRSEVTPELERILEKWETPSQGAKTRSLRFILTTYDLATEIERVADGELLYQAPDKLRIVIRQPRNLSDTKSRRLGRNGQPFVVKTDRSETWLLSDNRILAMNDDEKTYTSWQIPEDERNRLDFLLQRLCETVHAPFLLDIRADQLRKAWDFKLQRELHDSVVIIATPRRQGLKSLYKACWVKIDTKTWRTTAVKCIELSGDRERVYQLNETQVYRKALEDWMRVQTRFHRDLKNLGYKEGEFSLK